MFLEYFGKQFYVDSKFEVALTAVIYLYSDNLSDFVKYLIRYNIHYTVD